MRHGSPVIARGWLSSSVVTKRSPWTLRPLRAEAVLPLVGRALVPPLVLAGGAVLLLVVGFCVPVPPF